MKKTFGCLTILVVVLILYRAAIGDSSDMDMLGYTFACILFFLCAVFLLSYIVNRYKNSKLFKRFLNASSIPFVNMEAVTADLDNESAFHCIAEIGGKFVPDTKNTFYLATQQPVKKVKVKVTDGTVIAPAEFKTLGNHKIFNTNSSDINGFFASGSDVYLLGELIHQGSDFTFQSTPNQNFPMLISALDKGTLFSIIKRDANKSPVIAIIFFILSLIFLGIYILLMCL